jgi:hypothetical protein
MKTDVMSAGVIQTARTRSSWAARTPRGLAAFSAGSWLTPSTPHGRLPTKHAAATRRRDPRGGIYPASARATLLHGQLGPGRPAPAAAHAASLHVPSGDRRN